MVQQTRYNSLDIMKMFMAFLVVGIHVGSITDTEYPELLKLLLSTAVPFFFLCSGFFLQNKVFKTQDENNTIIKYLQKTLKLYVIWHLIYLPVDLRYMFHTGNSLWQDLNIYAQMLLFKGETYFTWPLWYLHGLLIAVIIIGLMRKVKIPLPIIWLTSIVFMIVGNAERNGLCQGFAFVSTGMMLCCYMPHIAFKLKDHPIYPTFRLHSTLIYFLHMYFILLMFAFYKDNQYPYLSWIVVFLLTWMTAYIIDQARQRKTFRWLNHLIA